MGRLERFLGKPKDFVIEEDGIKDTIQIYPITIDELPLFMRVMKMRGAMVQKLDETGKSTQEIDVSKLDPDAVEALKEFVMLTLKRSLPNEPENDLKAFAFAKFFDLLPVILEVNLGKYGKQVEKQIGQGGVPAGFQQPNSVV